jgi:hypothetical protein
VAAQPVAVRVLLQVDEVLTGENLERVAQHLGFAVRRRLQADDLGGENDRTVVGIVREVVDRGFDRQSRRSFDWPRASCADLSGACRRLLRA